MKLVVSIDGNGVTFDGPGVARLGDFDIWFAWPYVHVFHGALDPNTYEIAQTLSGKLKIQSSVEGFKEITDPGLSLAFGTYRSYPLRSDPSHYDIRFSGKDTPFWRLYAETAPPFPSVPMHALDSASAYFGPLPDPEKTNASGSLRVAAYRHAEITRCLLRARASQAAGAHLADSEWIQAADAWNTRQGQRGQHFYYRHQGYRLWSPSIDSGIPYGGYNSKTGGFHPLFNHPLPAGVNFIGSGLGVCDPQHLAHDQVVLSGLLTGNFAACMSAVSGLLATHKVMLLENFAGARAYGHWLRNAGVIVGALAPYKLFQDVVGQITERLIPDVLAVLEQRNHLGRFPAPVLDHGSSTDGGHLTPEEVAPLLDALGITDGQRRQDAAKSCSSWMASILVGGIDACLRFIPSGMLDLATVQALNRQLKVCAAFLLGPAIGAGIPKDADGLEPVVPEYVVWDDVAPLLCEGHPRLGRPLVESGGPNFPKGASIRWNAVAYEILGERLPDKEDRSLAMATADMIYEAADGWFNGKDPMRWNLESGWHRRGWMGG